MFYGIDFIKANVFLCLTLKYFFLFFHQFKILVELGAVIGCLYETFCVLTIFLSDFNFEKDILMSLLACSV